MSSIGSFQYLLTLGIHGLSVPVMNGRGRHQAQASMVMLVVIPVEEGTCPGPDVGQGAKSVREPGTILHGLELSFRVGIVIGGVGPGMTLGHAQVSQKLGHGLGAHRTAPVGVDDELVRRDVLLDARLRDQLSGQSGQLALGDHPADHVTAEDVQDDIQVVVGPLDGAFELSDIPAPELSNDN